MTDADRSRRRVIGLAVARRDDTTVADLQDLLGRLGIDAPASTVAADLEALGHQVDDRGHVVASPGLGTGGPDAAAARRWGRLVPVLAALSALLAVAAVVVVIVSVTGDDEPSQEADRRVAVSPDDITFGPDPAEGSEGDPDAPGGPVEVELTFEGDGSLPAPADGLAWGPTRGEWFLADGSAHAGPPGEGEAVISFAAASPDLAASVTLPSASPGAGVAFRLADEESYLAWVLTSDGTGVELVRVDGGGRTVLASPEASVGDEVVLGIRATGPDLVLLVDGETVGIASDDGPFDRDGVGLVVLGTEEVPSFSAFTVTVP
ncbi:MAG: hypothetical protein ACR2JF_13130 [Iamia sp.]